MPPVSEAVMLTVIMPETVAPSVGDVMETEGFSVSGGLYVTVTV